MKYGTFVPSALVAKCCDTAYGDASKYAGSCLSTAGAPPPIVPCNSDVGVR